MKQTYWEKLASRQTIEKLRLDISRWSARPIRMRVNLSMQKAWNKELKAREAMQKEKEKEQHDVMGQG